MKTTDSVNQVTIMEAGPEFATRMQEIRHQAEREMRDTTIEGISGGGMVRIVMSLNGEPRSVQIDLELHDRAMQEPLNDLVLAALQSAQRNIAAAMEGIEGHSQESMSRIIQELLPRQP